MSKGNALGYHDIRKHIIDILPLLEKDKEYWLNVAEGIYHRRLLQISIEHDDAEMAKRAFQKLHKLGELTYSDHIAYASYKKHVSVYFWRCVAKLEAIKETKFKV